MIQRLLITTLLTCLATSVTASDAPSNRPAGTVNVLHWWTSPSEAAAMDILKDHYTKSGFALTDQAVAGGGGGRAMTVLKSQVISGNPPHAAQISGQGIKSWASLGLLADIDDTVNHNQWTSVLPEFVSDAIQFQGRFYGVPVGIHRSNWLWVNPGAFEDTGLAIPTSWDELIAIAPRLRQAGFIPLTHGGEAWQQAAIFESVVLSEGGADFYRQALVHHDRKALTSPTMIRVFRKLKQIASLTPDNRSKMSWDQATREIINNKAAMMLMGDWALGEFKMNGQVEGEDFYCQPAFGTDKKFIYNIDSFVLFNLRSSSDRQAQHWLTQQLMNMETQIAFNEKKGSIPARMDAAENLQGCQQKSLEDLKASIEANTLVPSIIHGMAAKESLQIPAINFVSSYMSDPTVTPEQAVKSLSAALLSP
ncbi:ABC transporter substrate-binding protein [Endozoicomonas gorgoniicola]|uniref:Probable sugar-binding periplasmic protein n=1 Tax=Endozoicomonas gorgoniicola TaxID=1234144 RepID=A0ABT3MPF7_9GAMM|nr:ABC transporter substrate-binding protein [Endozoicomonas gorgoniicola]MCW7551250.1 ABC transporter substrate-binding protein [Endozoicomonas gorgoniicola]